MKKTITIIILLFIILGQGLCYKCRPAHEDIFRTAENEYKFYKAATKKQELEIRYLSKLNRVYMDELYKIPDTVSIKEFKRILKEKSQEETKKERESLWR